MKQTIYIDVLIAVNLFTNYFILLATAKFLHLKVNRLKVISGATIGAIFSLYILFPEVNILISLIIKLFISAGIVWITFCSPRSNFYLKTILCFYSINFGFSGIMLATWFAIRPNGMLVKNGVVYFNISPVILILSTMISYFIIEIISKTVGKRENRDDFCELEVAILGKSFFLKAKMDTGNSLKEPFSSLPVVVVCKRFLKGVVPDEYMEILDFSEQNFNSFDFKSKFQKRLRLIPFSSISGKGILPAFKPDYIMLKGSNIKKEAYIAVCPDSLLENNLEGLAGPEIFS